jgi:hypothetical protein
MNAFRFSRTVCPLLVAALCLPIVLLPACRRPVSEVPPIPDDEQRRDEYASLAYPILATAQQTEVNTDCLILSSAIPGLHLFSVDSVSGGSGLTNLEAKVDNEYRFQFDRILTPDEYENLSKRLPRPTALGNMAGYLSVGTGRWTESMEIEPYGSSMGGDRALLVKLHAEMDIVQNP